MVYFSSNYQSSFKVSVLTADACHVSDGAGPSIVSVIYLENKRKISSVLGFL